MWVEQKSNGKYSFRMNYTDLTGKRRIKSVTLNTDSRQSWNKAKVMLDQAIEQELARTTSVTDTSFSDLVDQWLAIKKKSVKPSTYTDYENRLAHLTRVFGHVPLSDLSAALINRTLLEMLSNGNKYKTVIERAKLAKNVIAFGVQYGYLETDMISEKITLPKINMSVKRDDKYLEPKEAEAIFKGLEEAGYEVYSEMLRLQMMTGMRFGEVAALRITDLKVGAISVERNWERKTKTFTTPKNGKSRLVYINNQTQKHLIKIKRRRKQLLMAYGIRDNNLLFFRSNGLPIDITFVNEMLHRFEISDKVLTTHIFRHTFITRAVENHIDAKLIAEQVGHSGTELIDRVYSHFSDKMSQDLKQAMSKLNF